MALHPSWERGGQPLIPERWSLPVCSGPSSLLRGCLPSVQWAFHSSLLREKVYPVFIPLERGGLPSGPFLSLDRGGLVGPSSLLREEVYRVCSPSSLLREEVYPVSGPFIPLERGGLLSVQWAPHPSWERRFTVGPSSLLREEVYPVCSWPFILLERGGLPSVQWALYPS